MFQFILPLYCTIYCTVIMLQGHPDAAGEWGPPQAQDQVVETEGGAQL